MTNIKEKKRFFRHQRIRKKIYGSNDQPRLCINRSLKNLSASIIDDIKNQTILTLSTLDKTLRSELKNRGNIGAAAALGEVFAVKAKEKGIKKVCFDRSGYVYKGRIKAFADAARKGGLEF